MLIENKKQLKNRPATLQDVEDSADEVMRSCAVQFTAIDLRFNSVEDRLDRIESNMATKTDVEDLYKIMVNRFDALESKMDRRFDEQDRKFEAGERRFQAFELYMQGHEKRIRKVEKHLAFA